MGNCIKKESPTQWGGEDWGSPVWEKLFSGNDKVTKIEEDQKRSSSSTQVKIKITKKQLEELLGRIELHGMSSEDMLDQLINGGDQKYQTHQRSWRPFLQSIPEVDS